MRLLACLLFALVFCSCNEAKTNSSKEVADNADSGKVTTTAVAQNKLIFKNIEGTSGIAARDISVGTITCFIEGKFSSKDRIDTAYLIKNKMGAGVSVEGGKADEFESRFTGSNKAIKVGCCDARLVNEGDFNNDGRDELTIFQYPENGNVVLVRTYSAPKDAWNTFIEPFMYPAAGEPVSDETLQSLVKFEYDTVFYQEMVDTTINGEDQFYPVYEVARKVKNGLQ